MRHRGEDCCFSYQQRTEKRFLVCLGSPVAKMTLRLEGKRTRWNKFYGGVNLKGTGAARSSRGARRSHFSARERGAVEGWDETGAKAGKYFGQIRSEPTSFGGQGGN